VICRLVKNEEVGLSVHGCGQAKAAFLSSRHCHYFLGGNSLAAKAKICQIVAEGLNVSRGAVAGVKLEHGCCDEELSGLVHMGGCRHYIILLL